MSNTPDAHGVPLELLNAISPHEVRIALSTRCNLRCVYCAVSQAGYEGNNMPADLLSRAVALIPQIIDREKVYAINVNGHGETTFMPGWVPICRSFLDQGLPVVVTTNLAKALSSEEAETMARMYRIMVSIDSADRDLLRRMRRKVDLRQIVANIRLIRDAALRLEQWPPPKFSFSCGLVDKNTLSIEDFARFAVASDVDRVGFWNLTTWEHERFPYQYTDVPEADQVHPLDQLSDDELRPRIEAIRRAIAILEQNDIVVSVAGDFVEPLAQRLAQRSAGPAAAAQEESSTAQPDVLTRDCLDPWTYIELGADGEIKPCCAHASVGNFTEQDPSQILNGDAIRRLRASLLEGKLDEDCARCRLRGSITPAALQEKVRALSEPPPIIPALSSVAEIRFVEIVKWFFEDCWMWLRRKIRLRTRLGYYTGGNAR